MKMNARRAIKWNKNAAVRSANQFVFQKTDSATRIFAPPSDRAVAPTPLVLWAVSTTPVYTADHYDHKGLPKSANIPESNLKSHSKIQCAYHLHIAQDGNQNK
jgi:hypothetical protein